jgi:hypothetical protein
VLANGWKRYRALLDAANDTLLAPGEHDVVDLATHRIGVTYPMSVDILVSRARVTSVEASLSVDAIVRGVVGVVVDARLTEIRAGRADVSLRLTCEGVELRSVHTEVDLGLQGDLGNRVVLVPESEYVELPELLS